MAWVSGTLFAILWNSKECAPEEAQLLDSELELRVLVAVYFALAHVLLLWNVETRTKMK